MTAVHPTAFKQQVAEKKEKEKFAKQKSTRYATLAGGLISSVGNEHSKYKLFKEPL
jgi:hypothetical protein